MSVPLTAIIHSQVVNHKKVPPSAHVRIDVQLLRTISIVFPFVFMVDVMNRTDHYDVSCFFRNYFNFTLLTFEEIVYTESSKSRGDLLNAISLET